jgi:hypothetical protein
MTTYILNRLENRIDNTLELSSVCRGEWCRSLESDVDMLESLVERAGFEAPPVERPRLTVMAEKLTTAYRNLGPNIHV